MSDGLHRRRNSWYFHVPASLSSDGKAHEESTRTDDYAEAKRIRRDRLIELERGLNLPAEMCEWTVRQAIEHWLDYRSKTGEFRKKTLKLDGELSKALIAKLGGKKLKEIGIADLRMYQAHRRASVKGRTVNLELRPLIDSLKLVGRWDPLEKNYQPFKREVSKLGRALAPEYSAHLIACSKVRPEWYSVSLAIRLTRYGGFRGCELKALWIGDFELERNRIRIRYKSNTLGDKEGTKTAAGERIVHLTRQAFYAAVDVLERAQALGGNKLWHYAFPAELSRHTNPNDPLHGRCGFDPTNHQQTFKTAWKAICKYAAETAEAAGLDPDQFIGLRFHDIRHTWFTDMARAGVPLEHVKGVGGHVSKEQSAYYTHILGDDQVAIKALESLEFFLDEVEKMPVRAVEGEEQKKVSVQ